MQNPSCCSRNALVLVAALCCAAVTPMLHADVTYLTQARSISAAATYAGSGTITAPAYGPFDESLRFENPFGWWNRAEAWQQSSLEPTRMDVQGGHVVVGGMQASGGSASTMFDVTFSINTPTSYSLFGYWSAETSAGYLGETEIEFSGPSGLIYAGGSRLDLNNPVPSHDYAVAGTLSPGTYRLKAFGRGVASGSTDGNQTSFAVSLLLPPPPPPTCQGGWEWGASPWEPNGTVASLTEWDPDGEGTLGPRLIAGGSFSLVGDVAASNIAAWDQEAQAWSPLGAGTNGRVSCTLALPDGSLIAGGDFTMAGSAAVNHIARWDGSTWTALGDGSGRGVTALTVLADGSIVAAGSFPANGQGPYASVGVWNGHDWAPLGPDAFNGGVMSLAVESDGRIVAGGDFYFIDGHDNVTIGVAAWDGAQWVGIGDGASSVTFALAAAPNGDIISGDLNGAVRRWNGSDWTTLSGRASYGIVYSLAVSPGGDIYAAGDFDFAQPCCDNPWRFPVSRWNGTQWTSLDNGMNASVTALAVRSSGELVAGGVFAATPEDEFDHLAQWNGSEWTGLPTAKGLDGRVLAIAAVPGSTGAQVVVGGSFTQSSDGAVSRIARCTDGRYEPLGSGINGEVSALAYLPNGDLIAGGLFTAAGGAPARSIARWDGSAWHPLGPGFDGGVSVLAVMPNGDLIAGGAFPTSGGVSLGTGLARWDGTRWWSVGSGVNAGGYVAALAVMPDGDLIVGGLFTSAGGVPISSGIARWDGTMWHALGDGLGAYARVHDVALLPDGSIVAAGLFSGADDVPTMSIARWDGAAWSAIGDGLGPGSDRTVNALSVLPSGELVVGGRFFSAGGVSTPYLATWDGNAWSGLMAPLNGTVHALAVLPGSGLVVGGEFSAAGNVGLGNLGLYVAASTPAIIEQPQDQTACRGGITSLSMHSSGGTPRWQVELPPRGSEQWVSLAEGVLPAATQSHASVTGSNTDTLAITAIDAAAALRYRASVTGGCGSVETMPLTLTFCPGDYNCDGGVDGSDVGAFFTDWEQGRAEADLTDDGGVDGADVEYFFVRWSDGC